MKKSFKCHSLLHNCNTVVLQNPDKWSRRMVLVVQKIGGIKLTINISISKVNFTK